MSDKRRTAFVTGASQGIGAAIALGLARDGYDVAVSSTRPEKLPEVRRQLEAAGARVATVALDVRKQASVERAMAETVAAFGHLDVLVSNAGNPIKRDAIAVTPEEWDAVIDTNLTGTFFMSQQMAVTWCKVDGRAASSTSPRPTAWWGWRSARRTASPRPASST